MTVASGQGSAFNVISRRPVAQSHVRLFRSVLLLLSAGGTIGAVIIGWRAGLLAGLGCYAAVILLELALLSGARLLEDGKDSAADAA
ncbi:MAG TPA: hypothetical protein VMI52_11590 [Acetobacteraceae bacterium]|nr:hypothetical protein [Acetobacteraceae bacterium]